MRIFGSYETNPDAKAGMSTSRSFQDCAVELVARHAPKGCTVLDLGAGSGVFVDRLAAKGFAVTAADLTPEHCKVPCIRVDLDTDFTQQFSDKYDAICFFEVLEHLKNPRETLHRCLSLLNDDGILFFSTPNASGIYSRVKFLFTGEMAMFSDLHYEGMGHITPITHWQMEKMIREQGLRILEEVDFDGSARLPKTFGDVAKRASWILRPLMRGHVGTQVMLFAASPE